MARMESSLTSLAFKLPPAFAPPPGTVLPFKMLVEIEHEVPISN